METLVVKVHDALVVCECGVQGSFSGDVGRLQEKHCYLCQATGRYVGTVLRGPFTNRVFWNHRDALAFASFALMYFIRVESLKRARIERDSEIAARIRDGEADIRNRLLLLNAMSTLLKAEVDLNGESGATLELSWDLKRAAELLAKSMFVRVKRKTQWRFAELREVLWDADAVTWIDPVQHDWKIGTLVDVSGSAATVVDSQRTNVRVNLPLLKVVRRDSSE